MSYPDVWWTNSDDFPGIKKMITQFGQGYVTARAIAGDKDSVIAMAIKMTPQELDALGLHCPCKSCQAERRALEHFQKLLKGEKS